MEVKNVFGNGMRMDFDKSIQTKDSLRHSYNGRVIFNEDGTFSWENQYGNLSSFTISADDGNDTDRYVPVGWASDSGIVIIMSKSTVSTYSEIGMVSFNSDGVGTYRTLFNDQNDPNSELLNFHINNSMDTQMEWETSSIIRCYWCDGVKTTSNNIRCITFSYDDTVGSRTNVNAYTLTNTSVHSINMQCDFNMGILKFVESINGGLKNGMYQYTYRLGTNSGYRTPFVPLTHSIFVTSDQVSNTNWNLYEMEGTGVSAGKGNRITVKGIDERFDFIEVAYLFSESSTTPTDSRIFSKVDIDSDEMEFDHTGLIGEPLVYTDLKNNFIVIDKAQTMRIKDQTLYIGNIREGNQVLDPEDILASLTIEPYFKNMRSDELPCEVSYSTLPLTNQALKNGTTTKTLYNGQTETYDITNDYCSYKGTQVSTIYPGFFRDETYRLGLIGFDNKGFPTPVIHLADITLPSQYDNNYSWVRIKEDGTTVTDSGTTTNEAWPTNSFGNADYAAEDVVLDGDDVEDTDVSMIRIMGLKISGLDFSSYAGVLKGFMFVVCDRDKTVLGQGLVMPTHADYDDSRPFASYFQRWQISGSDFYDVNCFIGRTGEHANRFYSRPNLFNLYAPDFDFDNTRIPSLGASDRLKLVGSAWHDDGADFNHYFTDDDPGVGMQGIQKLYRTKNTFHSSADYANGYPAFGDETDMGSIFTVDMGSEVADYEGSGLTIKNGIEIYNHYNYGNSSDDMYGNGKPNTLFITTGNWGASGNGHGFHYADDGGSITSACGYFICNYTRPNTNPYGGQTVTALTNSVFRNVGHFIPIDNPTFTTPGSYLFDDCEFFGGDCYLDYFGFLRIYPEYSRGSDSTNNDVSYGHIFPLESDLLHVMRQAPSSSNPMYPNVAARPKREWNGTVATPKYPDGLFSYEGSTELLEEFNLAECLGLTDYLWLLAALDPSLPINYHYPVRARYTNTKIMGDPVDAYRIFLANDFRDVNGKYGHITSFGSLFNYIYCIQDSAYGRLRALDRAMIESVDAGTLSTGIGDKLDGIDYISTKFGSQHIKSVIETSKSIYFVDANNRSFLRFAQDGLMNITNEKGIHDLSQYLLKNFVGVDTPYAGLGIVGFYDSQNDEVGWCFTNDGFFNETTGFVLTNNLSNKTSTHRHHVRWNNQAVIINLTAPIIGTNGMYLPEGDVTKGYLDLKQFYVKHVGFNLTVFTSSNSGDTSIGTMTTGKYYKFSRNYTTDAWVMTEVTSAEASMFYYGLTYNETGNYVSGIQPYRGSFFMWHNDFLFSTSYLDVTSANTIYLHNHGNVGEFYGTIYRSYFVPVINDMYDATKVFDTFKLVSNNNAHTLLDQVEMFTQNQGFYMDYQSDTRKKYREDTIWMPYRIRTQPDRMRGKYMDVCFSVSNLRNLKTRFTSLISEVRVSSKQ